MPEDILIFRHSELNEYTTAIQGVIFYFLHACCGQKSALRSIESVNLAILLVCMAFVRLRLCYESFFSEPPWAG